MNKEIKMSASQKEIYKEVLYIKSGTAPHFYGHHPRFKYSFRSQRALLPKCRSLEELEKAILGKKVKTAKLFDERHPSVYIIPSDKFICVVDESEDPIGIERTRLWFSSTDFYINEEDGWVFQELTTWTPPFWRLGNISQLGYLVPPRPDDFMPDVKIYYAGRLFTNTRWIHSLISAILAEVILARNGFSPVERAPIVLTVACHDIATPAGGESIKRIDPEKLNEENNFAFMLERHGLVERWTKRFDFNLEKACTWIKNKGVIGRLLDVVDKLSYVSIDCFHLGSIFDGKVRQYCIDHPLFMDVWQDICFTSDKKHFAFTNPDRLFTFLLARAYEHQELLLNPEARRLDFHLTKLAQPLYKRGLITKEQLLTWGDEQLKIKLEKYYAKNPEKGVMSGIITPDNYAWKIFASEEKLKAFCRLIGKNCLEYIEYIPGFNSCLDWPVFISKNEIAPLKKCLPHEKIALLKDIVKSVKGYYVYYLK